MIADIDKVLCYIAAGARVDVGLLEGEGRPRQCHMQPAQTLRHLLDPHLRYKIRLLSGKSGNLGVLLVMAPYTNTERAGEEQNNKQTNNPATRSAPCIGRARRLRAGRIGIGERKQRLRWRSL
jgi:hypothetical protein